MTSDYKNINFCSESTLVVDFFEAAYQLDYEKIKILVSNNEVDINIAEKYGHLSLAVKKSHMSDMFGSIQCGKVTCQIFEKIDHFETEDIKVITSLLKVLVSEGLVLEDVIYDKTEFSVEDSQYFWFTVIRKLLIKSKSDKDESYSELISYLDETLYRDTEDKGKIVRTTQLHLAVETSNHTAVTQLLKEFPARTDFITYMQAMPSMIFPSGLYDSEPFLITPVTLALKQMDLEMINIFCNNNVLDINTELDEDEEVWCWGMQPIIKRKNSGFCGRRKLSVCLNVLRKSKHFFDSTKLLELQDKFKSTLMNDFTLQIASVILAIEKKTMLN